MIWSIHLKYEIHAQEVIQLDSNYILTDRNSIQQHWELGLVLIALQLFYPSIEKGKAKK
jgi:hypothetical protein